MDELKYLKGKIEERIAELDSKKQPWDAAIVNVQIQEGKLYLTWINSMIETLKKRGGKK